MDFITGLVRYAVPCFLMISGKYLLGKDENSDADKFYKKEYKKLFPPVLVYSLIGLLVAMGKAAISLNNLLLPIKALLLGRPYYHLWYMYTLAGIYLLVPGIIGLKKSLAKKKYTILGVLWFCTSCISTLFCEFTLAWGVHTVACFSSYLVMGDIIGNEKKIYNKRTTCLLILISIACFVLTGYWELCQNYILDGSLLNYINASNNFSPTVALGSIALFASVKGWNTRWSVHCLTKYSLHIYLVHVFFLEIFEKLYGTIFPNVPDPIVWVVLCTAAVFCISYVWSRCTTPWFEKVYQKIAMAGRKLLARAGRNNRRMGNV